jgi:hypothetical protein
MGKWLLVLLALIALGFSALFGLPQIVSDCAQSPLPQFGVAAGFLLVWSGVGLFAVMRGDLAQRTVLFAGIVFILLGYGYALSSILAIVLRDRIGC